MFEPIPELSSDLEWMLQSGQASHEMLVEALVNEYYFPVYHLAYSLLDDSNVARITSIEIFSTALLNVYRYRSTISVRTWINRIAVDVCRKALRQQRGQRVQNPPNPGSSTNGNRPLPAGGLEFILWRAVDSLPEQQRVPFLLENLHGWPVAEIAEVLQLKESFVQSLVHQARGQCIEDLLHSNQTDQKREVDSLNAQLQSMLQARWQEPQRSGQELDLDKEEILERAGSQGSRRRRLMSIKEIALTLIAILLVAGLIWGANMLMPEPNPDDLPVPTGRTNRIGSGQANPGIEAGAAVVETLAVPTTPQPSPEGMFLPSSDEILESEFYIVKAGDSLEEISNFFGYSVEELRTLNRLAHGQEPSEGQSLYVPDRLPAYTPPDATPVTPVFQAAPVETPAGSSDLARRIQQNVNSWNTLWIDAQSRIYGPEGYIGPPRVAHSQVWISREQLLLLVGSPGGDPDEVILRNGSRFFRAKPGYNQPWFLNLNREEPVDSPIQDQINLLFAAFFGRRIINQDVALQVVGIGKVANREALVIDQVNADGKLEARLWMDEQTGFILRRRQFIEKGSQRLINEVIVNEIAYDVDFPQELFDPQLPWRGGFARDFTGEPIAAQASQAFPAMAYARLPLPNRPPPAGFDVSQSTLTFYYSPSFSETDAMASTYLFADEYYLGNLVFGNPWKMVCNRSPDGEKVAFVSEPNKSPPQNAFLGWYNLSNLRSKLHRPLGETFVTHFAFGPDSRRLAAFGFSEQYSVGAIYIVDTETDEYQTLNYFLDAKSFVWSPDGNYLAMIASPISLFEEEVIVIQTNTGEITYRAPIEFQGDRTTEWPMSEWGVEFPVEMGGLDACVHPPVNQ